VVVIPVADADRSKAFYAALGWRLDADFSFDNGFRVVQLTPPGSLCSVQFGTKITGAPPGSAHGLHLVVSDIDAGRDEPSGRVSGPDPEKRIGKAAPDWPDCSGEYMVREQTGQEPSA
jgi:catechol 2,3-dioxygenase-like lactoylglutathione lyase family enzyme